MAAAANDPRTDFLAPGRRLHAGTSLLIRCPRGDAAPPSSSARLCKDYGARRVVTDVSFALARGEWPGPPRPNGAARRPRSAWSPASRASAGTITGPRSDPPRRPTTPAIKGGLGIVQQDESLGPRLERRAEPDRLTRATSGIASAGDAVPRAEALMRFASSPSTARPHPQPSRPAKNAAYAARALLNEPRLHVLDEPTTGPRSQARRCLERIPQLKRQGTTILLTRPLHGGGRAALRPHHHHGPRPHRRRGHAGGAGRRPRGATVVEVYLSGAEAEDAARRRRAWHRAVADRARASPGYLYLRDGEAGPASSARSTASTSRRRRATL